MFKQMKIGLCILKRLFGRRLAMHLACFLDSNPHRLYLSLSSLLQCSHIRPGIFPLSSFTSLQKTSCYIARHDRCNQTRSFALLLALSIRPKNSKSIQSKVALLWGLSTISSWHPHLRGGGMYNYDVVDSFWSLYHLVYYACMSMIRDDENQVFEDPSKAEYWPSKLISETKASTCAIHVVIIKQPKKPVNPSKRGTVQYRHYSQQSHKQYITNAMPPLYALRTPV